MQWQCNDPPQDVKTGVADWLRAALELVREALAEDPELLKSVKDV